MLKKVLLALFLVAALGGTFVVTATTVAVAGQDGKQ
jgi:hypothetical protein